MLSLAGGLAAAGCADHGSYTARWTFTGGELAGAGCGQHGVDSIRVTGTNTKGDGEDVIALCAPGAFTHEVPVGDWTFTFQQLDVRGVPIQVPDPTASESIGKDRTIDLAPVELAARPECGDGIDNDGDGRIDLDDLDCAGDPNTAAECTPGVDC